VNAGPDRASAQVAKLARKATVEVLESSKSVHEGRIRARIVSPEGWITTSLADGSVKFADEVSYVWTLEGKAAHDRKAFTIPGTVAANDAVPEEQLAALKQSGAFQPVYIRQAYLPTQRRLPTMVDPRDPAAQKMVKIRGFYYPGRYLSWDTHCEAPFCGNFWIIPGGMRFKPPGPPAKKERSFANTESAFQCTKFWENPRADEFETADGEKAFKLKGELGKLQPPDTNYSMGPNGSNWTAMMACLRVKFANEELKLNLLQTGDDFLLEHNDRAGRDPFWSDNADGTGRNWLGLQLMVLRDELAGKNDWTSHIYERVSRENGNLKGDVVRPWAGTVMNACESLKRLL